MRRSRKTLELFVGILVGLFVVVAFGALSLLRSEPAAAPTPTTLEIRIPMERVTAQPAEISP